MPTPSTPSQAPEELKKAADDAAKEAEKLQDAAKKAAEDAKKAGEGLKGSAKKAAEDAAKEAAKTADDAAKAAAKEADKLKDAAATAVKDAEVRVCACVSGRGGPCERGPAVGGTHTVAVCSALPCLMLWWGRQRLGSLSLCSFQPLRSVRPLAPLQKAVGDVADKAKDAAEGVADTVAKVGPRGGRASGLGRGGCGSSSCKGRLQPQREATRLQCTRVALRPSKRCRSAPVALAARACYSTSAQPAVVRQAAPVCRLMALPTPPPPPRRPRS